MGFRENLKRERIRAGFPSARKFAKAVGITYTKYINYESKKSIEPPYNELIKIADFLNISLDVLLDRMDEDTEVINYTQKVLKPTPFRIKTISDEFIRIELKGSPLFYDFDRISFLNNMRREKAASKSLALQLASTKLAVSIKIIFMNFFDFNSEEIRAILIKNNIFDIPVSTFTLPNNNSSDDTPEE